MHRLGFNSSAVNRNRSDISPLHNRDFLVSKTVFDPVDQVAPFSFSTERVCKEGSCALHLHTYDHPRVYGKPPSSFETICVARRGCSISLLFKFVMDEVMNSSLRLRDVDVDLASGEELYNLD